MTDQKQGQSSGKPNKFNEQNKQTEERKAGENVVQNAPINEPATEKTNQSESPEQNK
jgi:hypothetical protein